MRGSAEAYESHMELVVEPWATTLKELEAERDGHPKFADVRHLLGMMYLEDGQWEPAWAEFDASIDLNSSYMLARYHRMVAMRCRDGELDPGFWNQETVVAGADEPHRSTWTSWYLSQSGDHAGAIRALEGLCKDAKWAGSGYYQSAVRWLAAGEVDQCMTCLQQAAGEHPVYARVLNSRGLLGGEKPTLSQLRASLLGNWKDASTWTPSTGNVYDRLGNECGRAGAPDQAEACFEDSFLRQGEESLHQVRIARLALACGDEDAAVSALRRAIEVDPSSVEARVALGFEYQSQGYHDEALVQFEVAARLRPGYADIQYNLGLLYESQSRDGDACTCHQKALAINPRYFQARTSLAQLLLRLGKWDEALTTLRPLEQQGVRSADLLVQKAEAHLALEEYDAAIRSLDRAVEINSAYPRTYYILGQVYRKQGLKNKAQEAWKQHLEKIRRLKEDQPYLEGEEWRP